MKRNIIFDGYLTEASIVSNSVPIIGDVSCILLAEYNMGDETSITLEPRILGFQLLNSDGNIEKLTLSLTGKFAWALKQSASLVDVKINSNGFVGENPGKLKLEVLEVV